jgi:4-amino-4-deoxy-L-arabinose transferase-like glycosyltransferase
VKMLAAYVVLPAFVLLYLLTAPLGWRTRLGHLAVGAMVLLAVSWSWALVVDLTPPAGRPYVGDSRKNTELDLILGYNGIARIVAGTRWGGVRNAGAEGTQGAATAAIASGPAGSGPAFPTPNGRFGGGEPGPLRLANRELAAQITWLSRWP